VDETGRAVLSAVSTYAALRVALRGVASVASLVATSCRVVALRVAARGCALLVARGVALRWPPCILLVTCPHTLRVALRGVASKNRNMFLLAR